MFDIEELELLRDIIYEYVNLSTQHERDEQPEYFQPIYKLNKKIDLLIKNFSKTIDK